MKGRAWRWAWAGLLALGVVYTWVGFWGLPWLAQHQLQRMSSSLTGLELRIGLFEFNPYTLRLQLQGVQWGRHDQAPLMELDRAVVGLQWASLWRREWRFETVQLRAPVIQAHVGVDGRSDWVDVWQAIQTRLTPTDRAGGMPAWQVDVFELEQGRVDVQDLRSGYVNQLEGISVRLDRVGSLSDQMSPYLIKVQSSAGEGLDSQGAFSVLPLRGSGELSLRGLDLAKLSAALKLQSPWVLQSGRMSARLPFQLEHTPQGLKLDVSKAEMKLQHVMVLDGKQPLIDLAGLDLVDGQLGFTGDRRQPMSFQATLHHLGGGRLMASGHVVPASMALTADIQLDQLPLALLQSQWSRWLNAQLTQGLLSVRGQYRHSVTEDATSGFSYRGSVEISDLVLNDLTGQRVISAELVRAEQLEFRSLAREVLVPQVHVMKPYVRVDIDPQQGLSLTHLLKRESAAWGNDLKRTGQVNIPSAAAFHVRWRRLQVEQGRMDFSDRSVRPAFKTTVQHLEGVILGLSSDPTSRTRIELEGQVDAYGRARIRGDLALFHPLESSDVRLLFNNIDMASISPYMMKFGGYRIREGRLSADLRYVLRGHRMEGTNDIVVDSLVLGERVDSPNALDLPLEMAIALLKDERGRIELGLPISGDLNDPQISYGAIVWKALGNLLTGFVTAPFRTLSRLLGVKDDGLDAIEFDAGSDRLPPPEQEKIQRVADLLKQRPQFQLLVPQPFSDPMDRLALNPKDLAVPDVLEKLAQSRSHAVMAALQSLGVNPERMRIGVRGAVEGRSGQQTVPLAWSLVLP